MTKYFFPPSIKKNLSNIPGWRTDRHLIIFESDDWGSIRMPSIESFKKLEKSGLDLRSADAERYNLFDNLATTHDLGSLFEILSNVKDCNGRSAVFTPATIVANPDFLKILNSDFREYFYEPFTDTLKRFQGCEHSFDLWKEGIAKQLFVPQMHGREHLNVTSWMNALKAGEEQTRSAFKEGLWGFVPRNYPATDYQAAFLLGSPSELKYHEEVIIEGLNLFEKIFGYTAEFFVPPNGVMNNSLNNILFNRGIRFRYASRMQFETLGNGKSKKVIHWLGQKDNPGISYILRNCFFEPSQQGRDWIDSCLNEIKIAFRWHKPAIISSHRVNYIGALNPANRDNGLNQLSSLLKGIKKIWPDVEFITTPQLGALMEKK